MMWASSCMTRARAASGTELSQLGIRKSVISGAFRNFSPDSKSNSSIVVQLSMLPSPASSASRSTSETAGKPVIKCSTSPPWSCKSALTKASQKIEKNSPKLEAVGSQQATVAPGRATRAISPNMPGNSLACVIEAFPRTRSNRSSGNDSDEFSSRWNAIFSFTAAALARASSRSSSLSSTPRNSSFSPARSCKAIA